MVRAVGVMDSTQDSGSCNPGSTPGSRIRKPCYNSIYKQNAANLLQIITKKDESFFLSLFIHQIMPSAVLVMTIVNANCLQQWLHHYRPSKWKAFCFQLLANSLW